MAGRDDLGLIHDHTWHLKSAVLVGQVTDVVLVAHEDESGSSRLLRVDYRPEGTFVLDEGRKVRMEESEKRTAAAGNCYELRAGTFHLTAIDAVPTVTLLLGRPSGGSNAYIASAVESLGSRLVERQLLDKDQAANTLDSILAYFRNQSEPNRTL